jgi:hypothetical protein
MPSKGILILVMTGMIIGALPVWPYAKKWGFYPSGWLSLSLIVFIGLLLCGLF